MKVNVCKLIEALFLPSGRKLMYMEPRKKTRELKNKMHSSVESLLQHTASCCSLIKFKVWMKQFTWLPRDFTTHFGNNCGVSYLGNYLIIGSYTLHP